MNTSSFRTRKIPENLVDSVSNSCPLLHENSPIYTPAFASPAFRKNIEPQIVRAPIPISPEFRRHRASRRRFRVARLPIFTSNRTISNLRIFLTLFPSCRSTSTPYVAAGKPPEPEETSCLPPSLGGGGAGEEHAYVIAVRSRTPSSASTTP